MARKKIDMLAWSQLTDWQVVKLLYPYLRRRDPVACTMVKNSGAYSYYDCICGESFGWLRWRSKPSHEKFLAWQAKHMDCHKKIASLFTRDPIECMAIEIHE